MVEAHSGRELLEQIRAMDELTREDGRIPRERFEELLIWAVGNPYRSWEGSRAASMAARLLSYIKECQDSALREWPADDPDEVAPPMYWHPNPAWRDLDAGDTCGLRDAWRTRLQGPPGQYGWDPAGTRSHAPEGDDDLDDAA